MKTGSLLRKNSFVIGSIIKFVFCILLFSSNISFAQNADKKKVKLDKKNLEFYNNVASINDLSFEITTVPEDLSSESYVVLASNTYITIDEKSRSRSFVRKRILLQDDKAVNEFAEFFFQKSETTILVITKKDGSEFEVDLKDAILVKTQIPRIYRYKFQSEESYKLAIPNLEVGDIIDYISIFSQNFDQIFSYSDIIGEDVHVLNSRVIIDINRKWSVFRNTFNTDLKFKETKYTGFDIKGKPIKAASRFALEIGRTIPIKYELLEDFGKSKPVVKFMAFIESSVLFPVEYGKSIIDTTLPLETILRNYYKSLESNYMIKSYSKQMETHFEMYRVNRRNNEELADMAYYLLRNDFFEYLLPENAIGYTRSKAYTFEDLYSNSRSTVVPDIYFLHAISYLLKECKFEVLIVGMVPKSIGSLENLVNINEVTFGVYLPAFKKYYWAPNMDRTHEDVPFEFLEGAIGVGVSEEKIRKKENGVELVNIEPVAIENSRDENEVVVSINTTNMETNFTKKSIYFGPLKYRYSDLLEEFGTEALRDYNEVTINYNNIFDNQYRKQLKNYEKDFANDNRGLYQAFAEKSNFNQKKAFEDWVSNTDYKTELIDFKVISNGRIPQNNNLEVEAKYTSEDFAKKMGPNILVSIGSLIESQFQIEDKDRNNRNSAINFGYKRKYEYAIKLAIPGGYSVESIEKLNKVIDNAYVSFKSDAKVLDNFLIINTIKEYKVIEAPIEAWPKIVEGLDAAYKFSQEKIVMKRK